MIKKFESFVNEDLHNTNRKISGKTPIFTLNAFDITTDEGIEDMKYIGQTYYSEDDAIDAAREMANAYSDWDGVIIVSVMAGEYEMPSGDIYGEPMDIYTISNKDKNQTIQAREESGYTNAEVDEYIIEMNNKNSFDTLNESFTNQELKDAIKAHGGLSKLYKDIDARTLYTEQSNSFDLVNCKYCGYISPEIVKIIDKEFKCNIRVWYYIYTNILKTNDGGAIIIDNGDDDLGDEHRKWIKKMKIRNNNWKEDWLNNNTGKSTRLWIKGTSPEDVDDHKIPDRFNTSMRRSKHINRK